jgi:hypothetical protein
MRSDIQQKMNISNYIPPTKTPSFVPGKLDHIRFQTIHLHGDSGLSLTREDSPILKTGFQGLNNESFLDDQRCNKVPELPTLTE